jgi:CBS domain-containing protein
MQTAKQVLELKGDTVWSVTPADSVYTAIELMADKSIGALVVLENAAVVGILSERDYARKVILRGRSSRDTPVKDIMSDKVVHTDPHKSIEECISLMSEKRIRHLPVIEDNRLVGLVSMGDLVKALIAKQQMLIEQLEHYISG